LRRMKKTIKISKSPKIIAKITKWPKSLKRTLKTHKRPKWPKAWRHDWKCWWKTTILIPSSKLRYSNF
jgi:hypothetical protein